MYVSLLITFNSEIVLQICTRFLFRMQNFRQGMHFLGEIRNLIKPSVTHLFYSMFNLTAIRIYKTVYLTFSPVLCCVTPLENKQ